MIDLREAVRMALSELGVPQPGYPAPVAEAVKILRLAQEERDDIYCEVGDGDCGKFCIQCGQCSDHGCLCGCVDCGRRLHGHGIRCRECGEKDPVGCSKTRQGTL